MRQLVNIIQSAIKDALADTHTATVGRVVAVNETTVDIQPVINAVYNGEDIVLPVFAEVPLINLQGGTSYLHMPVAVGDYGLVFFTERSFDRWYAGTDEVRPPELRMHDYSDGFAIVGVNNQAGALVIPDVINMIGDALVSGDHDRQGDTMHTGDYILTGEMIINGNLTVNGNITCSGTLTVPNIVASTGATIGGIPFGSHTHGGVQTGGGNTGGPQ